MKDFKPFFVINKLHDKFHNLFPEENLVQTYYSDDSYVTCYPNNFTPNYFFGNFWNWYQIEFPVIHHSERTWHYFQRILSSPILFKDRIIKQLVFSIRYTQPLSLDHIITKINSAFLSFEDFTIDPFENPLDKPETLLNNLTFITSATSPTLKYQRNLLFVNEDLNLGQLFDLSKETKMTTYGNVLTYLKDNLSSGILKM